MAEETNSQALDRRRSRDQGPQTIRAVAELARVSQATVSRVLNGYPTVGEEHRRRVLEAADRLGYRPNRLARNLRLQRVDTLGVLVPDIENPHFSEAVRVFEDAAFRAGYRLLLCNTDESEEKQRAYAQVLADERVLGVIAAPADNGGVGLAPLFDLDIPVVAFDRLVSDPRADAVVCDNTDGTRRATEHLIWLGHERIAYIGGRANVATGAERLEGYAEAMRSARLTPFAVDGGFRTAVAEGEVSTLVCVERPPSALVVGNNLMALGAMRAIRSAGLRIPADIAVVAVDDPPWAELVDPPLTVLAQPVRRMAERVIQLLLNRINGYDAPQERVVLPLDLRIRDSCGMRATSQTKG